MSGSTKGATQTSKITTPTDREIHIERIFDASRDRVWRAFTEPDLLAQWWGRGNKLVIERLEVKPGGHGDSSNTARTACTASKDASAR